VPFYETPCSVGYTTDYKRGRVRCLWRHIWGGFRAAWRNV